MTRGAAAGGSDKLTRPMYEGRGGPMGTRTVGACTGRRPRLHCPERRMGLTIPYTLHAPPKLVADARAVVEQLRQRALDLPFRSVGDLLDLSGRGCDFQRRDRD